MEIIITESQLSKILTEQNTFVIKDTYKHIVDAVAGVGTDPDMILNVLDNLKTQNDCKTLFSLFKDQKTGYSSFDEMINGEYENDNYSDIVKLVDKLHKFGVNSGYRRGENRLGQFLFTGNFKTTFGKDPNPPVAKDPENIQSCKSKWSPNLNRAKDYWIQWLSSPITKSKFKKNWAVGKDNKIDGITVDELFRKYIKTLNSINLVYYDNMNPPYSDVEDAYAFVMKSEPTKVYVNCSQDDKTPYETLIHEIQHTLYYVKPLNPSVKIGDVFVKEGTKKMTPKDFFNKNDASTNTKIQFNKSIKEISKKYGVDGRVLHEWLSYAKESEKEDPGYSCETTEKMSNIMAIRKYFNLKPGGNITKEMLKPYINREKHQTDIYWVLYCWALKGFPDINIMLDKINQLAYQDTKQNNDTRIA